MILVTGDVVLDHHMYEGTRLTPDDREGQGSRYTETPGGAKLTFGFLKELAGDAVTFGLKKTDSEDLRSWPQQFHTRALWHLVPNGKDPEKNGKHWALKQQLGYGEIENNKRYPASPERIAETPAIVVIDDGGLGFRDDSKHWPSCIQAEVRPQELEWVILKMSRPLAEGPLWEKLKQPGWREHVVLIVSAEQLRNEGLRVAGGLSWETTAFDIVRELSSNPDLRPLTESRHLIVTVGGDAALWIDKKDHEPEYRQLIFDRERCEGEWEEDDLHRKWQSYGYLSAITASVTWSLTEEGRIARQKPNDPMPDPDDFTMALASGLSTTRYLREQGHGPDTKPPAIPFHGAADHLRKELRQYGKAPAHAYTCADLEGLKPGAGKTFTILGQVSGQEAKGLAVSYEPARRVACFGPDKLPGVPCATFGKLRTMDRREIDSLRYLRQLMLSYDNDRSAGKPLCLAVFGAPGSGKSFGVKQIALAVFGEKNPILQFNLAQYSQPSDLIGAYHQIRDKVLQGFTPVVFWDEFDSKNLDWLQYFLAPMQDGAFQQGEVTHTLGKCVFVFAGGTSYTFTSFRKPAGDERFTAAKGPDFASRLAGFLDIAGPDRRRLPDSKEEDASDREFPIRRALLIRSALGLKPRQKLRIEQSLLNALLGVTRYSNGARSIEKLITAIRDRGSMPLRRAHLPPDHILSLYVEDVAEFHGLMERFQDKADLLAPFIHEKYLATLTDEQKARQGGRPLARPWDASDEEFVDMNVMAARRIPDVLAVAGYSLKEGPDGQDAITQFTENEVKAMAEAEHRGWEECRRIDGWSLWRSRNNLARHHPLLKAYDKLLKTDQRLDRQAVLEYPNLARKVGYRIVRAEPVNTKAVRSRRSGRGT